MQTVAERLEEKGWVRGKAEGMAEGKAGQGRGRARPRARPMAEGMAKGMAEGKADTLLMLLARRFDTVPKDIRTRIHAASIEELDAWVDAVLSASCLDDVFRNGARH